MKREEHYLWRCRNVAGRSFTTRYHCSEEQIRVEHPEAERVDGTLIVRYVPETPEEQAASMRVSSTSGWRG